jgi:hypothetical protein
LLDPVGAALLFFAGVVDFFGAACVVVRAAGSDCGGFVAVLCAAIGDTAIETDSAAASHRIGSGVEIEGFKTFMSSL